MFASFGIGIDRLVLEQWRDMHLYLALHNDIDIGLDPFPYNGGTSTFHSLFMGVPVITLAGDHTVSRVGVSILAPLGLDAFVAQSEIEYVERAVSLAADVSSLKEVRALLRGKLLQDHQ
jgi:predicted O-linked N-acetylglucosamine transferase (SPINDLY family)